MRCFKVWLVRELFTTSCHRWSQHSVKYRQNTGARPHQASGRNFTRSAYPKFKSNVMRRSIWSFNIPLFTVEHLHMKHFSSTVKTQHFRFKFPTSASQGSNSPLQPRKVYIPDPPILGTDNSSMPMGGEEVNAWNKSVYKCFLSRLCLKNF